MIHSKAPQALCGACGDIISSTLDYVQHSVIFSANGFSHACGVVL